jgi:hypothetical protein
MNSARNEHEFLSEPVSSGDPPVYPAVTPGLSSYMLLFSYGCSVFLIQNNNKVQNS